MGSISLFAPPGSYSFTLQGITVLLCQGDEHSSLLSSRTRLLGAKGEGAWPKRLLVYLHCGFIQNLQKLGKSIGSSQIQAKIIPGEQWSSLFLSLLPGNSLTCALSRPETHNPVGLATTGAPCRAYSFQMNWALTWSRDFGHWLLSWPCWGHGWKLFMAGLRGIGRWKPRGQLLFLAE